MVKLAIQHAALVKMNASRSGAKANLSVMRRESKVDIPVDLASDTLFPVVSDESATFFTSEGKYYRTVWDQSAPIGYSNPSEIKAYIKTAIETMQMQIADNAHKGVFDGNPHLDADTRINIARFTGPADHVGCPQLPSPWPKLLDVDFLSHEDIRIAEFCSRFRITKHGLIEECGVPMLVVRQVLPSRRDIEISISHTQNHHSDVLGFFRIGDYEAARAFATMVADETRGTVRNDPIHEYLALSAPDTDWLTIKALAKELVSGHAGTLQPTLHSMDAAWKLIETYPLESISATRSMRTMIEADDPAAGEELADLIFSILTSEYRQVYGPGNLRDFRLALWNDRDISVPIAPAFSHR